MGKRKAGVVAGMGRSRTPRGPSICHDCRRDLEGERNRVPILDVPGGHWIVCDECALVNGRSSR